MSDTLYQQHYYNWHWTRQHQHQRSAWSDVETERQDIELLLVTAIFLLATSTINHSQLHNVESMAVRPFTTSDKYQDQDSSTADKPHRQFTTTSIKHVSTDAQFGSAVTLAVAVAVARLG